MGLFTAKTKVCTIDGKRHKLSEFRNPTDHYTRKNDNLRRRLNRASKGRIGTMQLRNALANL